MGEQGGLSERICEAIKTFTEAEMVDVAIAALENAGTTRLQLQRLIKAIAHELPVKEEHLDFASGRKIPPLPESPL